MRYSFHIPVAAMLIAAVLLVLNAPHLFAGESPASRELLSRYRDAKARISHGSVADEQVRESGMVLMWGQLLELLTTSHVDDDTAKSVKWLSLSVQLAERRLSEALTAYDSPGDSYVTRRGTFFAAYVSTMDKSGQPYVIHVPKTYGPNTAYPLEFRPASYVRRYDQPRNLGQSDSHIVVASCGRGQNAIEGLGELDAVELIRHVRELYSIDPDRIYLTGGSIGGGGVWRLAARYPDIFAAALVDYGWTWTSTLNIENASNLPMWIYQ